MLLRSLRAAAAAAAALLFALTPSLATAAAPTKEAPAVAKKKDAGEKSTSKDAAKKDAADKKGANKKGAADKKSAAKKDGDKTARKDAANKKGADKDAKKSGDKKDAVAKKDAAGKGDKKDAGTKAKLAKKDDPKDSKKDKDDKAPSSIGAPNKGKLRGAVKLHASRALKIKDRATTWGLPELVKLLQRAAGKVAKKYPKSVMLVGDLSQKQGGPMLGHNSHQTGRDADVGFYVSNSKGKPAAMTRFVAFDAAGKSSQVTWAQFDDARNWALVEALLTDKDAPARHIFISNPLRLRLLAYASKKGVSKDLQTKAALAMMSPRDADVHDDHFHVRIHCPESMRGTCHEDSLPRPAPAPDAVANAGDAKTSAASATTPVASAGDAKTPAATATAPVASAGDAKIPAAIAKPDDATYE